VKFAKLKQEDEHMQGSLIDWLVRSLEHDLQQTDELVRGRDSGVTERGPDSASARWPPTSRPSSLSDLAVKARGMLAQ
jgi:hypothetical protein